MNSLNLNELRRPKLPIVLAYINSVIDNSTLWSPPKKEEPTVLITAVSGSKEAEGVSVSFDPENGDKLPGQVSVPRAEQVNEEKTIEVSVEQEVQEAKEPEETSGFIIKRI